MERLNFSAEKMRIIVVFIFLLIFLSEAARQARVTDHDLQLWSEELLDKDVNNAACFVHVNYQARTRSGSTADQAPQPLLTVDRRALQLPTVAKVLRLFDNYVADAGVNEQVTAAELREEADLLDAFVATPVMRHARQFLLEKGLVSTRPDAFKTLLRDLWFTVFSRGQRRTGSSAFEHVFLGELKRGEVSGLHSWIFFGHEESRRQANYLGWIRKLDLGSGSVLKLAYTWLGVRKPVGSMFVGTSPELEMAVYTVCFLTRANERCRVSLGGVVLHVKTYSFSVRGRSVISSAYPDI
ncbi:endoribonuclease CG2145-like isoform X1 [Bacillus rossius redtenbacheri]|uniref:endoribonuclease CG2145-like isoform X1 n=1 Tax=Bacillus rossius redtenbacheri TaxID=93214 RepID=UPI002FDEE610